MGRRSSGGRVTLGDLGQSSERCWRAIFICTTWRYSGSLNPSPRAPARKRASLQPRSGRIDVIGKPHGQHRAHDGVGVRGKRGPYTTRGIRYLLAELGRRAEVAHVHPHRFRHDTARRLVEAADLPAVAAWLGHERLDTVRIYSRPDDELKKAPSVSETIDWARTRQILGINKPTAASSATPCPCCSSTSRTSNASAPKTSPADDRRGSQRAPDDQVPYTGVPRLRGAHA
jgi:Phage integrase family